MTDTTHIAAAFYHFAHLPDYTNLQQPLLHECTSRGVMGTVLLAEEGVNGTISGTADAVRAVLDWLRNDPRLAKLVHKESPANTETFHRMRVKLKKEIVTLGVDGIDPVNDVGTYVAPEDWNALISNPDVVLIDCRNDYEVAIGTFEGAIDPKTKTFREFPDWVDQQENLKSKPKVAMFCTGGIRCEKSTALMRAKGFDEVYHLQGGILKYLEEVPEQQSKWQGDCFVFDERVSIGHGLKMGEHELCRACRFPITDEDKASPLFEEGVSCPHCYHDTTPEQKAAYAERHKQVMLAMQRGEKHVGAQAITQPNQHQASLPVIPDDLNELPILYSFRRCPYAMRARLALYQAGIRHQHREVVLRDKPQELLSISPKGTVPVLELADGRVIEQSFEIMQWALDQTKHAWRMLDEAQHQTMLDLVTQNDGAFKHHLDRYKYPERYDDAQSAEQHRAQASDIIATLEARLNQHSHLLGDQMTIADAALAPFMRQFAHVDADWFEQQPWPKTQQWLQNLLQSALFKRVMTKHKQWHPNSRPVVIG